MSLLERGEERGVCSAHVFQTLSPNPVAVAWPEPVLSKQQGKRIAALYICPHFQQAPERQPSPPSVSPSDPRKEDSVPLTRYHSLCTHLALLSITLRTFLLTFTITLFNSQLRESE